MGWASFPYGLKAKWQQRCLNDAFEQPNVPLGVFGCRREYVRVTHPNTPRAARVHILWEYAMKILLTAALTLLSSAALAQSTPPAANPKPDMPAVATPSTPAPVAPAAGSNSFTMSQAQSRIEAAGYTGVTDLAKDKDGIWRGMAMKNGASTHVSLDYQGNVVAN